MGKAVRFTCKSYGLTKWFSHTPTSDVKFENIFFPIASVNLKDNGYYYCFGTYSSHFGHFLSRARLKVYGEDFYSTIVRSYCVQCNRISCMKFDGIY